MYTIKGLHETYTIRSVSIEEALALQANGVQMYDYTKLTAINTCPTWGVLRYGLHRTEHAVTGRELALEAGSACHLYFEAIRWWHLLLDGRRAIHIDADRSDYIQQLHRSMGAERAQSLLNVPQDSDRVTNAINFGLEALHSSGYYDDPSDRRRTMANLESACIAFTDRYFRSDLPIYTSGNVVGIELPFVLEVTSSNGNKTYYTGRIDGVHRNRDHVVIGENKTSSRLSEAWRMSFHTSHQVTGYCIAASVLFNEPINEAIVMGTQIPQPRALGDGVVFEPVTRHPDDYARWCEWLFECVATYEKWQNNPTYAPRYTHSCNRYFRPCQFIPFCTLERSEQAHAIEQMNVKEWNPLHSQIETKTETE